MDEFESRHVRGSGREYYRDKIPVPRWLAAFGVFGTAAIIVGLGLTTSDWLTASAIGAGMGSFGFLGNLALMGLRMVVSDAGVDVWVGIRHSRIALDDIASCELDEYRFADHPFGRGQIKWGPRGRAYLGSVGSPGATGRGVRIHLRSGSSVLLASTRPEELRRALERALGAVDAPERAADGAGSVEPVEAFEPTATTTQAGEPAEAFEPTAREPEVPAEPDVEYEYVGVEAGPPARGRERG